MYIHQKYGLFYIMHTMIECLYTDYNPNSILFEFSDFGFDFQQSKLHLLKPMEALRITVFVNIIFCIRFENEMEMQ